MSGPHSFRRTRVREHQRSNAPRVREHERHLPIDPRERHAAVNPAWRIEAEARELAQLSLADYDANVDHNERDPTLSNEGIEWDQLSSADFSRALDEMARDIVFGDEPLEPSGVDARAVTAAEHLVREEMLRRLTYWKNEVGVGMTAKPGIKQVCLNTGEGDIYVEPGSFKFYQLRGDIQPTKAYANYHPPEDFGGATRPYNYQRLLQRKPHATDPLLNEIVVVDLDGNTVRGRIIRRANDGSYVLRDGYGSEHRFRETDIESEVI